MPLVSKKQQIIENIVNLEKYLVSGSKEEKEFARNIVRKGKTIVVYKVDDENHFAPSRFVGYQDNDMNKHISNDEKDDKKTNSVITKVIGRPFKNEKIDGKFTDYCNKIGVLQPNHDRSYWRIKDERGNNLNIKSL